MKDNQILKEILEIRNWSQVELANELNLSRQSVYTTLNTTNKGLDTGTFIRYINVMGCDLRINDVSIGDNLKPYLKELMKEKGITQEEMANRLGYKRPSSITNRLNKKAKGTMRTYNLIEMLDVLGVKAIVRDRMGTGRTWVLDNIEETEEERKVRLYKELGKELEDKGLI